MAAKEEIELAGVRLTSPDKVLYPEQGITKRDLAEYYAAVAPAMVPLFHGRPLNLQRYPDGLGGKELFTQQAPKHFPDWIRRATCGSIAGATAR